MKKISDVTGNKCVISGLVSAKNDGTEKKIADLTEIIEKNGGTVVGSLIQRRGISRSNKPGGRKAMDYSMNTATYLGQGKANDLKDMTSNKGAAVIVFLNKLSPSQINNLCELTGCIVIDSGSI